MLKLHPLILCVKKSIPPTAHGIRRQNLNSNWNHGFFGPNFQYHIIKDLDLTKTANLNEKTKKNTTHNNTIHVKNASMQTF